MEKYINLFLNSYKGYASYLMNEVLQPSWHNYFWWLLALSIGVWLLEIAMPWRTEQAVFRKDFWLDGVYLFFNFFIFSLIGFAAISEVFSQGFKDILANFGIQNLAAIELNHWPVWAKLLTMFVIADFIQWNIHRLLHRVPMLWEYHKLHHSVEEMGVAAHFRYHFMENIIYKTLQYIPLAMLGLELQDFFIIHIISVALGHLNHSNLNINYGLLKYIFNNPAMHIWHHAKEIPANHRFGVNFGLSLSVWDYLFGTAHIPDNGRDIALGFEHSEDYPNTFWKQMIAPFRRKGGE
jgi:sterol desaturase/sphingolipid hydroxylase (fatty acid hydroxylase superfamily)